MKILALLVSCALLASRLTGASPIAADDETPDISSVPTTEVPATISVDTTTKITEINSTECTTDVPVTSPAETTSEVPVTSPAETTSEVPVTSPAETTSEVPVTSPAETTSEVPVTSPAETTSEVPVTSPAETTSEVPVTSPAETTSEVPVTSPAETTSEVPVTSPAETTSEVPVTSPAETTSEVPVTSPAETTSEVPVTSPAETTSEVPVTSPAETTSEVPVTSPAETTSEVPVTSPAETTSEVPVTSPAETTSEVPVTSPAETTSEVPVTSPAETTSEVPVTSPAETTSEVPVTSPAETTSEVPVTSPAETTSEVPVTSPAETTSEVPVTSPAETTSEVPVTSPAETTSEVPVTSPAETTSEVPVTSPAETTSEVPVTSPAETTSEVPVTSPAETTSEVPVTVFSETTTKIPVVVTDETGKETILTTPISIFDFLETVINKTEETTSTPRAEVLVNLKEVQTEEEVVVSTPPSSDQTDIVITATKADDTNVNVSSNMVKEKLSEQIRKVLLHYQRPDPIGFPGAPIPESLSIPPMRKNFGMADMTFTNMTIHGLSKFTVERVNTDLDNMQVYVLLKIRRLYILGNYTMKTWFSRPAAGPFNVTLIDVDAEAAAALEPDADGYLQTNETEMDMQFADCNLDFKNLGFMASVFQGMISTVGSVLFDGIKPFIINEVNTNMRADINNQIKTITSKLPKMKMPVTDMAVIEGRKYVMRMGYDPYRLTDRKIKEGPFSFTISNLTVYGLSKFRRVGEIGVSLRGHVLQLTAHVITSKIHGSLNWAYELVLTKNFNRTGMTNFTIDHLQVRAVVNQSLDIREKPILHKLDIEVGNINILMDRQVPLDYVVEIAVNSLPPLLRHIIVDALEEPIKIKVQTLLNDIRVDQMVEERLPELDNLTNNEQQTQQQQQQRK
ncbi:neurofilament heavy polypeptide-like [Daktulosphaira vitifoliae]|uniref:neurofilament heavy polypeptide-like n=1 Tax=Daktulosphaira vitifoliae TaxID=58002 RepID=UPI0021AA5FE2|nr:neurofilament heavy polypeptide-like [Daktulosphaira vitifoliae]